MPYSILLFSINKYKTLSLLVMNIFLMLIMIHQSYVQKKKKNTPAVKNLFIINYIIEITLPQIYIQKYKPYKHVQ